MNFWTLSSVIRRLGKCMQDSFISNLLSISTHTGYVHILLNGEEVVKAAGFWSIFPPDYYRWVTWLTGINVA